MEATIRRRLLVTTEYIELIDRWKFFHHTRLGPREIRLFRFTGESENDPKRWEWECIHISLDNLHVPYKAFSYTWGDPSPCSMMFLSDDYIMAITKSVEEILVSVVEKEMRDYFWVDALCICQTDLEEKSAQVRMMGEIYTLATGVIVSLGSPSDGSDTAMLFIPALYNTFQRLEDLGKPITIDTFVNPVEEDKSCLWPSEQWIALHNLLERAWFQRVWVVQEVVMNANVVLICGSQFVEWSVFAILVKRILANGLSHLLSLQSAGIPGAMASVDRIDSLRAARKRGPAISLESLLLEFISYNSTDPRDKIYALMSLASDGFNHALDPDYTVSTRDLFIRSSCELMKRHGSSLLLLHAAGIGYPRLIDSLPSWVPDFSLTRGGGYISNLLTSQGYRASGDSHADICPNLDSNRLTSKGVIVDRIRALSSMPKDNASYLPWINSIATMIGSLDTTSTGDITTHELFWRTIIADRTHNLHPAPVEYAQYYESFVAMMNMKAGETVTPESDFEAITQTLQEAALFRMALNVNLSGRQAFVTHGHRAGLASPETLIDDVVCIPLGSMTPFILRENSPRQAEEQATLTYQLVGESYVHGIMHGEGLKLAPVQNIVLT